MIPTQRASNLLLDEPTTFLDIAHQIEALNSLPAWSALGTQRSLL